MIKQFIFSVEAPDEEMIDKFIMIINKQAEALKDVSPIKIFIEQKP